MEAGHRKYHNEFQEGVLPLLTVLTPAARLWLRRLVDGTCVNSTFTEFVRSRGLGESLAEDKFLLKWAATLIHADAAHQPVTYSFEVCKWMFGCYPRVCVCCARALYVCVCVAGCGTASVPLVY